MTNPNFEQLAAAQKANAEVLVNLLRTAFGGLEKLTALNLNTGRDLFDTSVANAQKLLSIKDPAEASKIAPTLAQPGVEKLVSYSQSVYDLVTSLQKEVSSVVESQYQTFTKNAVSAVEKAKSSAPVGGDVFAAALNSVIDASNKAFENMNAAAKQMAELAETNVKAATEAAAKVAPVAAPAAAAAAPAAAPSKKK